MALVLTPLPDLAKTTTVSGMRSRGSIELLTDAYSLARRAKLLEWGWFRRAFVSSYFLYKELYEDPFLRLLKRNPKLLGRGDILDVGANIGYTAAIFGRAVHPGWKVYAFEPDRYSFGLLRETVSHKHLADKIEAMHMAVGANEGFIGLWHNEKHSADHRVVTEQFRKSGLDAAKIETVRVTSVDTFVAARGLREISFIKIDVQGYEIAVCKGMTQTLERFPHTPVSIEYDPETTRKMGFDPQALLDFFRTRGYRVHVLTRAAIEPADDDSVIQRYVNGAGYVDLICSKLAIS
jgi:FkbM family methyltransferase